ncbi:hypothetical protein F5B22DRAFT_645784 [Xylaria bambusicola]|uniref:uncharacterized protein n=1 Tax=Xylaria bambusicola TaxID=326684 RepID=UPI0020088D83|nr:uncharacterized protein F5B22DRAFT_645784 [Xylaria bambusicola]KAI0517605.1 hypothetical protein F5B22DRAFT_645784 [Xylaria bambusicola]
MPRYMRECFLILNAIAAANKRAIQGRRSRLEQLPTELKLIIIGFLPDGASIINLSLSGPDFCAVVCAHEKKIIEDAMTIIPPSLVYLAVANYMISTAPWHINERKQRGYGRGLKLSEAYGTSVLDFVELYRLPQELTLEKTHPENMSLIQADIYLKTYMAVSYYAKLLSKQAMLGIPEGIEFNREVTSTVLARYEKALYIMQLVSSLFSWQGSDPEQYEMVVAWGVFWFSLFPWEIEQVFCVQRLLERHIGNLASKHRVAQHGYEHSNPQEKVFLSKFVVHMGPLALWQAEMRTQTSMSSRVEFFMKSFRLNEFLTEGVALPGFGATVTLPRAIQQLESPRRDKIDQGPMELWYYTTVVALSRATRHRGPEFFNSQRALIYSAYMLWDRMQPDSYAMPPLEEMQESLARFMHQFDLSLYEDLQYQMLDGFPIVDIIAWTILAAIAEIQRFLRRKRN